MEEKAGNDHPGPPPTAPVVGPFAAAAPGACSNKGPYHMPCSIAHNNKLPKQTTARHLSKMLVRLSPEASQRCATSGLVERAACIEGQ